MYYLLFVYPSKHPGGLCSYLVGNFDILTQKIGCRSWQTFGELETRRLLVLIKLVPPESPNLFTLRLKVAKRLGITYLALFLFQGEG